MKLDERGELQYLSKGSEDRIGSTVLHAAGLENKEVVGGWEVLLGAIL